MKALIGVALAFGSFIASAADAPRDGWARWTTASIDDAPAYCCFGDNHAAGATCSLEKHRGFYGHRDHQTTTEVQVFAKYKAGRLDRVQSYAIACPVDVPVGIADLGVLETHASYARLSTHRLDENDSGQALAIAMHPLPEAVTWLARASTVGKERQRQDALLWLGQLRAIEGRETLVRTLRADPDDDMRRHAIFVVAESVLPDRLSLLLTSAADDADSSVRRDAWFWYGQQHPPEAESRLTAALHAAGTDDLKDHLVFVLSQLPGDRGLDALVALIEDRKLDREIRNKALFWLGQSEHPRAMLALDRWL